MTNRISVKLTPDELALLREALDSHIYWQLSDEQYRHSGYVFDPGSEDPVSRAEIAQSEQLISRLFVAEAVAPRPGDPPGPRGRRRR